MQKPDKDRSTDTDSAHYHPVDRPHGYFVTGPSLRTGFGLREFLGEVHQYHCGIFAVVILLILAVLSVSKSFRTLRHYRQASRPNDRECLPSDAERGVWSRKWFL